jgi:hypothetical protein
MEINRSAWSATPGEVVKVTWPEYGMREVVMRIGQVDYGKPGDHKVKVSLIEDIFSLATAQYTTPGGGKWQDPSRQPEPITNVQMFTAPTYVVGQYIEVESLKYPEVSPAIFAQAPNPDTYSFELLQSTSSGFEPVATLTPQARGTLSLPLQREAQTTLAGFGSLSVGEPPAVGCFIMIGSGAETAIEIAFISAFSTGVGYTIKRGCLDTVPRDWPAATPFWLFLPDGRFVHQVAFAAGSSISYKLLPQTSLGILDAALAPVVVNTVSARPHLPTRPANVKVANSLFGPVIVPSSSPVAVTWSNRNRLLEDAVVLGWTEATMAPESGQTTVVQVRDTEGTLITEHAGLSGTSFSLPIASFEDLATGVVRVISRRDGLDSLQGIEIQVSIEGRNGWGFDWGNNWGGGA